MWVLKAVGIQTDLETGEESAVLSLRESSGRVLEIPVSYEVYQTLVGSGGDVTPVEPKPPYGDEEVRESSPQDVALAADVLGELEPPSI